MAIRKFLVVFIIVLTLSGAASGCLPDFSGRNSVVQPPAEEFSEEERSSGGSEEARQKGPEAADGADSESSPIESAEPEKFYPTPSKLPAEADSDKRDFVVNQELKVKLYLVEKYDPGICYGMPGPVPEEAISGMIDRQPELAEFLAVNYDLKSDLEIYNRIKQLNGVRLTEISGGKYQFNFTDGQCCTLTIYQGEAVIIADTVSDKITSRETKQNPC